MFKDILRSIEFPIVFHARAEKSSRFPRGFKPTAVWPQSQTARGMLPRDLAISRTTTLLHTLWAHNPSICPQFFLAAKPQTYKGGSGRIGGAQRFDSAMRAAIPPFSTIPRPFQNATVCLELLFSSVCIENIYIYTYRKFMCACIYNDSSDGRYLAHGWKVFPVTFVLIRSVNPKNIGGELMRKFSKR